jgi:hypothetical protein
MRLTLTQFVTLDGVYQGPGSPDEDPSDGFTRGGWMVPHMDRTFIDQAAAWLGGGRRPAARPAHLRGVRAGVAPDHRSRRPVHRADERAPEVRRVAHADRRPWSPSTILRGDIVAEVARSRPADASFQLHGSARLLARLLAAGLIDEVRLVITPTVLGQGRRLLPTEGPAVGMHVTHNSTTPGGLAILVVETTSTAELRPTTACAP